MNEWGMNNKMSSWENKLVITTIMHDKEDAHRWDRRGAMWVDVIMDE
jgi:hypothetical protein